MSIFNNIFGKANKQEPVAVESSYKLYRHHCLVTTLNDKTYNFYVDYNEPYGALDVLNDLTYSISPTDEPNLAISRKGVLSLRLVKVEELKESI